MLPGGGDELQGIKKGILELADAIVVNKADGASEALARTTQQHYRGAMSLLSHEGFWEPRVMTCSALHGQGIEDGVGDDSSVRRGCPFSGRVRFGAGDPEPRLDAPADRRVVAG